LDKGVARLESELHAQVVTRHDDLLAQAMGIQKLEGACNVGSWLQLLRRWLLHYHLACVLLEAMVFGGVLSKGIREARCHAFSSGGIAFETTSSRSTWSPAWSA
jgi:hypothetical protein